MKIDALDHVALSVRDAEHSARWYAEVLGFERQHEGKWGGRPVFLGNQESSVALFQAAPAPDDAPARRRILHFAFRTGREAFISAQGELRRRGVPFEFEDHEISHSIYFRDPDGHQVEVTTYEV